MKNNLAILITAYRSLLANPGRSLLTILGIIIGIVAIVLVISIGQGAERLILGEIEGLGGNVIIIRPGRQPESPTDVADTILADSITSADIEALRQPVNVPNVASVDPAVLVSGEISYQNNIYRPLSLGWTATAMSDSFNIYPEEGSAFTADDIRQRAKVAILGIKVKQELFGASDAIGRSIKMRGQNLRVIGVYPPLGQISAFNIDEILLLPYSTAQKDLLGIDHFHEIFVRAQTGADVETVADDIRATLRERHDITDPAKDDFFVLTQQDIAARIGNVTTTLTVFLVSIASISLIVGGVGIMNIMLVSVTERTHEIGLRKAVGATNTDILKQFLTEAVILTAGGGLLGTIIALLLNYAITIIIRTQFDIDWPNSFSPLGVLIGVGVAAFIGVVFGIYPAKKAAAKEPIEALRYE